MGHLEQPPGRMGSKAPSLPQPARHRQPSEPPEAPSHGQHPTHRMGA
ncbi:hypothetical protein A176_004672 [Myxococcus hansupus]|uniref:Uncharacterized protein n=1 Tax=Pseudomyxococcus hansupus TaxID=1297742 RepID=A0A0H4X285_9BACT|nr:hypothetical protein A176_004672 [Myxococcus hansupus]